MDQASSPEYDRDLSAEDRDRLFKEQYARALADMRYGMGPLSVAPVFSPNASGAKVSANVAGVEPYVVIDPSTGRPTVVEQGVTYGSGTPESGYQLRYSKNERTGQPVYSGAYRRRLDRDSEITAQGSYVPMPGRDAYQAMLQYRKRFAEGGEAKTDDDPIRKLYRETLAREADTGGLEYWRKEFGPEVDVAERMRFIEGAQPEVQKRMAAGDTTLPAYMKVAPEVRSALQSTDVTTDEYKRLANYFGNQWIAGEAEDPASLTRRDYIERPRSGYDLATFLASRSQQHGAQPDTNQRLLDLVAPYTNYALQTPAEVVYTGGESNDFGYRVTNPITGQQEIAYRSGPLGPTGENIYRTSYGVHHSSIGDPDRTRYAVGLDYTVDPATGQATLTSPYLEGYQERRRNNAFPIAALATMGGMAMFPGFSLQNIGSRGLLSLGAQGVSRMAQGGEVTDFVKRQAGSPEEGEAAAESRYDMANNRLRGLNEELQDKIEMYRQGQITAKDLQEFFPGYSTFDLDRMFGTTDTDLPRHPNMAQPRLTPKFLADALNLEDILKKETETQLREGRKHPFLLRKDMPPGWETNMAQGGEVTNFVKRRSGSPEEGEVAEPPELKATPQNPMLGFLAKALKTREEATKDLNSPTASLLNLILPTSQTVEKWSYGDPLFRMPPSGTGGYVPVTSRDKGYVAETIGYAPIGLPAKAVASGAMVGPPLGVIRPKGGGNLLSGDFLVEKTIESLRPTVIVPDNKGQPVKVFASEQAESLRNLIARQKSGNYSSEYGESILKEMEPQAALDDWIKNKFGNYIKKQMGTEDDPVRKLADEMSEKVQADYQAGLKRIAKMKDDIAKAKAKGKRTDVSEQELADEIDRVEEAFQNASILPSQLGPYTHVSASLGEAREKAGFSPYEIAKSMQGKAYEELADTSFVPITVGEFKKKVKTGQGMGPGWSEYGSVDLEANPWISKLKDEDVLYRIRPYDINEKQVFTHTIDELRNALNPNSGLPQNLLLKPEDMQGLGIEKAFRHVNKINDWRAQQRAAASLEEAKRSAVTIKEYPDTPKRLQWQQLKPVDYTELPPGYRIEDLDYGTSVLKGPDGSNLTYFDKTAADAPDVMKQALSFLSKNDLEKALQYEGSTMRHCVGGYCDSVWTGETNIFSLRDRKGEPHVTIETAPPDIRRDGNTPLDFLIENPSMASRVGVNEIDLAQMNVSKDLDQRAMELGIGRMPSVLSVETNRNIIKLPEFQEWLRSKPSEILQIKGKGNAKPKEDYIPFVQDFIKSQQWSHIGDYKNANITEISPTGKFAMDLKRAGYDVPRYITDEEFDRLADIRDALLDQSKKNQ